MVKKGCRGAKVWPVKTLKPSVVSGSRAGLKAL